MIECFKSARKKYSSWRRYYNDLPTILRGEILITISILLGTINFGIVVNEFVQFGELKKPWNSTYTATMTKLVFLSLTVGFYLGITGFVYSCIRKSYWKYIAVFAMAWNLFVLILRVISEVIYVDLRPEAFGD